MPLTATAVKQANPRQKDYKMSDGGGLFLLVKKTGSKYWRLKYRYADKEKSLALGVYPEITLSKARELKEDARRLVAHGTDPSELRRAEKSARNDAATNSFKSVAEEWFRIKMTDKSTTYKERVDRLLANDLLPYLGRRPIAEITPPELLAVLRRIESRGARESAHKAKQVVGLVIRYAIATGRAERDPSTDLKGALQPPIKGHHAALTKPSEVGKLMMAIDAYQGTPVVRTALRLSPLLFCRPGELRHMEWSEINWKESRWELPAGKMKMNAPHIVPLSRQAMNVLRDIEPITSGRGKYVLPSARGASRPLSENGVRVALRTMGFDNQSMTAHGFRATARTLLDEVLGYRIEWIECQLAHAVKDANGRAYNRTSYLKQRREMMQKWADYLDNLKSAAASKNVIAGEFGKAAG